MQTSANQATRYRPDIDGLRAVAVMLVVFFHTELGFRGGFVGVDVFFVISGFLITGILLRDMESSSFSLVGFWVRRIRRIMPAGIAVLLCVMVAGYFLMTPVDYRDLGIAVRSQALFSGNIYFWHSTGYFDGAAYTKPLLHTWSLALEEQFYLLLPLILLCLFKFFRRGIVASLIFASVLSFLVGLAATVTHPNAAYYLLPARAWELLLGSVVAAWKSPPKWLTVGTTSFIGTVLIVGSGMCFTEQTAYPGMAALAPCLGAAAVLLGNAPGKSLCCRWYQSRPLVFLGQISYSLYLWHWPIISFVRYRTSDHIPMWVDIVVVLLSILLAYISWKLIENPFRRGTLLRRRAVALGFGGVATGVVFACATVIVLSNGFSFRFPARILEYAASQNDKAFYRGLTLEEVKNGASVPLGPSRDTGHVELVVWGDSHAMCAVPPARSLCEEYGIPGAAFTRPATPPVLNYVSPTAPGSLARDAVAYNAEVLKMIARKKAKRVLLAAFWTRELERGSPRRLLSGLIDTVDALHASGVTVYFMRTFPVQEQNVPRLLARAALIGADPDTLGISVAEHRRQAVAEDALVRKLEHRGVIILDPTKCLSDSNGICRAEWNEKAAYWDSHHLTLSGALRLTPILEDFVSNDLSDAAAAQPEDHRLAAVPSSKD